MRPRWFRYTAAASAIATAGAVAAVAGTSLATTARPATMATSTAAADTSTCNLGHGIKHVVEITFDNVHYFRDNPNVPSDLELMPNLLNFFENNGTVLANNHTPLIAHTADDILTTYTGLYGDRHGVPIANGYQVYNSNGTSSHATSFTYWTDKNTSGGSDTNPNMTYSALPGGNGTPGTVTPAPWVPFTRAGCNVGEFSSANTVLENTGDIPQVFGASSPEAQQLAADPNPFKDAEVADYIGVAVHCAKGNAFCANARGVKFGQTSPSPTAAPDLLPDEPGGYRGFQGLFGARYVAPQLGAGTPNLSRGGYQVTNAAGNLVDLNGNQINGAFLNNHPGFPGFDPTASQTLAYAADMLETGVPVVYGYISDIHGNEDVPGLAACKNAPSALGPGTPCYLAQAAYWNQAFGTFFKRLTADGITTANTLFILSSDEGDHVAGANVGRAIQPAPANCDGVHTLCSYPSGTFGELATNVPGLLAAEKNNTTAFGMESDSAPEYYLNGNPGPNAAITRTFERDVAGLTAFNPYAGQTQPIANYLADRTEEAILHMVDADPARTPTVAEFAKPDYFLSTGGPCNPAVTGSGGCVSVNPAFAYNHGDLAAEIDTNYVAFAGPGVLHLGVDGPQPADGPNSAGPDSGQVLPINSGTTGTWTDETDIRPTLMYLTGLIDDYTTDGRVITQILASPNSALAAPGVAALGACYKQLNSSVGQFASYTLQADTKAIESDTAGDVQYLSTEAKLAALLHARDLLAVQIKDSLTGAAFQDTPVPNAGALTAVCQEQIAAARNLAG